MTSQKGRPAVRGKVISDAEFRRLYTDQSVRLDEIAAMLGISASAVVSRARSRGLPLRGFGKPYAYLITPDREAKFRQLWLAGVKSRDIAQFYQTHSSVILRNARRLGLPKRGRSWQHCGIPLAEYERRLAEVERRLAAQAFAEMARAESKAAATLWKKVA